ncbi:tRNA glutamyl-Q(34) synthetase GluQRS [Sodalis ligni]|jgi:glutamyl-Q tRNA(Asp) synthetase|uniref:Glutamyl-Q tRNA(Asp) synthetase n=1 Tax=Sodalis ligni TaxID=2697027 RepID=A0A4R1NG98_9GAMM|nr:tRNA glutamyl-Q(34) synthetase GluQRS [Sodalis ligni]QWA10076.1 tRNA glutamyl-Q(34) synthetase GluQRS [Sodalis ligni]TCL06562.1 glutamyl-Q tRNA(Asp) synthetase [Sodalis ligni]
MSTHSLYTGRFAPSPSGALHFGSLVAALGSYLQARASRGLWRVRIEDIDPPREIPGAADTILRQLADYGLHWDGQVWYQSQRREAYLDVLAELKRRGLSYYCHCSRARIQALGGRYDGHCSELDLPAEHAAIRLRQTRPVMSFRDGLRGEIRADPALAREDFIIRRRDGLFAYNLAVVVDDAAQGITEVVRGADLIEPTVRQLALYRQLGYKEPAYIHLPLALTSSGMKLSKQNHAPVLPGGDPRPTLLAALRFLNQPVAQGWRDLTLESMLDLAIEHWSLSAVPLSSCAIEPVTGPAPFSKNAG